MRLQDEIKDSARSPICQRIFHASRARSIMSVSLLRRHSAGSMS